MKLTSFFLSVLLAASASVTQAQSTIKVTDENFAHAETARNFRNWVKLGANKQITHMNNFHQEAKRRRPFK